MNEIAFVIRFCYARSYPAEAREFRFRWFRDEVLPRILAQRYQGFDIWLWAMPEHRREIEAWSPRIRTFGLRRPMAQLETSYPWHHVVRLPRYPIQVRVDSDDLVSPDFLSRGIEELAKMSGRRAIAWYQPEKVAVSTGAVYTCRPDYGNGSYSNLAVPAFLLYRQRPRDHDYSWVYARGHIRLGKIADEVRGIEAGYCWAACHGHNDSTGVWPADEPRGQFGDATWLR